MERSSIFVTLRAPVSARLLAAVLVGLITVAGLGALEPDELRPGMDPSAVAAIYTSHRSCSNSVFLEQPGFMSWDATLYNRSARIEVKFDGGLARVVAIRILLESGDDGADIVRDLTDEYTRLSGLPEISAGDGKRWVFGTMVVELSIEVINGTREVQLVLTAGVS